MSSTVHECSVFELRLQNFELNRRGQKLLICFGTAEIACIFLKNNEKYKEALENSAF
jgi:hypothetical protein